MPGSHPYIAARVIVYNGVRAYNPGDLVPASAVEGDSAWLILGDDVEYRPGMEPAPVPAPKLDTKRPR